MFVNPQLSVKDKPDGSYVYDLSLPYCKPTSDCEDTKNAACWYDLHNVESGEQIQGCVCKPLNQS